MVAKGEIVRMHPRFLAWKLPWLPVEVGPLGLPEDTRLLGKTAQTLRFFSRGVER